MTAPTAAPIARDVTDVRAIARHACRGLIDGTVRLADGDTVVAELTRQGWHEYASHVRLACETRRHILRCRGFSVLGGNR